MKKPLSKTLEEEGIAFSFPIRIENADGNRTYYETSDGHWCKEEYNSDGNRTYYETSNGFWCKEEYNSDGNRTYYESSDGYWCKREYDADGNETYFESSDGDKLGTPKAKHEGKVVTVDGVDYELKEITEDEKTTK